MGPCGQPSSFFSWRSEQLLMLVHKAELGNPRAHCHLQSGKSVFDLVGTTCESLLSFTGAVGTVQFELDYRPDDELRSFAIALAQNSLWMTTLSPDGLELAGSGFAFIGHQGSQRCIPARFFPSVARISELPSYQLNRSRLTNSTFPIGIDETGLARCAAETSLCPDITLPVIIENRNIYIEGTLVLTIPAGKASVGKLYLFADDEAPSGGNVYQRIPSVGGTDLVPIGQFENFFV